MPNGDPRGGFFYPTLTLMMDPYYVGIVGVGLILFDLMQVLGIVPKARQLVC